MVVVPKALNPYVPNLPEGYTKDFKSYLKDIRYLNFQVYDSATANVAVTVPDNCTFFLLNVWATVATTAGVASTIRPSVYYADDIGASNAKNLISLSIAQAVVTNYGITYNYSVPLPIVAGKVIFADRANVATLQTVSGFCGFLVANGDLS